MKTFSNCISAFLLSSQMSTRTELPLKMGWDGWRMLMLNDKYEMEGKLSKMKIIFPKIIKRIYFIILFLRGTHRFARCSSFSWIIIHNLFYFRIVYVGGYGFFSELRNLSSVSHIFNNKTIYSRIFCCYDMLKVLCPMAASGMVMTVANRKTRVDE